VLPVAECDPSGIGRDPASCLLRVLGWIGLVEPSFSALLGVLRVGKNSLTGPSRLFAGRPCATDVALQGLLGAGRPAAGETALRYCRIDCGSLATTGAVQLNRVQGGDGFAVPLAVRGVGRRASNV